MWWKKLILSFILSVTVFQVLYTQKIISEARVEYTIKVSVGEGSAISEKDITGAFGGALQVVWFKGNMVKTEFTSANRSQHTIFNAGTGEAVVYREAGSERYMWNLDATQWKTAHKKYAGAMVTELSETKEIAGFLCKKAYIQLSDSTLISVYFNAQLQPIAKGYDPMFEKLAGFPVMYEWVIGGTLVSYTLSSIQNIPVSASRFESPKSGYKIIKAPVEEPN